MRINELEPLGAEIDGWDLAAATAGEADRLKALLADRGVAVIRGQDGLDDDAFVAFLSRLGEMTFTEGEQPLAHQPALNFVSNKGRTTPPRSVWHSDTSYVAAPPAYTALRGVEIPEDGGETLFSCQYRAWEGLPATMREALRGCTARHGATGVADATVTRHPLVRRHPVSRREALFLTTPERVGDLSGLEPARSERVVDALYRHSVRRGRVLRHRWRPGDVVIWDNRCTMHRADHSATVGPRVLHRGMVAGERPIPVAA
ncbi:MAG: TauD/TfdA dioxygenase family protein [Hasllibacter sp.]